MRRKRLAKLQGASSPSNPSPAASTPVTVRQPQPAPISEKSIAAAPKPASVEPEVDKFAVKFKSMTESEWQASTLKEILQVTLEASSNINTVHLAELAQELRGEGMSLALNSELMERSLYARLTLQHHIQPLAYLIMVWKRTQNVKGHLARLESIGIPTGHCTELINDIEELTFNYAGLVLNPDMEDIFHQPEG